jgi:RND family efflux transporter MFP subunit
MQARYLFVLGLLLAAAGCNEAATQAPEVRPVRTTTVDPKPIPDDRRAVGEIKPRHESDLAFRIAGKVVSRDVDIGTSVRKGDLLARLDDQDYRNKLKAAQADLVAAQAVLTEAQAAEGRLRQLLSSGSTTRANYDGAMKNLRSAEAKLDSAKSGVEQAKDQLAYTELRADFDGIVTSASAEAGQVVNTGQMIVRVARSDEKDAVFTVAESVLGEGGGEKPEITVSLLSNPNVTAEGVVREISPISDPATRTYQVKVTLKNPPEQMRFGGSVAGRLKTSTVPVVVLPGSALFDRAGQPAVWVVDPARGAVGLKLVVAERYETDRVIVSGGLSKGDIVVTAGVNRLRENQKVQLAEGAAP